MGPELRQALRVLSAAHEAHAIRTIMATDEQREAIEDAWDIVERAVAGDVPGDK